MARHSHAANVRADGLSVVLGPLARDPALRAALLVDVDSGMVLDGWAPAVAPEVTTEELGATHAELMRIACAAATGLADAAAATAVEVTIAVSPPGGGASRHVVVRGVADPFGDRLALSVLVDGSARALRRVRRRLGELSTAALTAGPTVSLRPRDGAWVPGTVERPAAVPRSRLPMGPAPTPSAAPVGGPALAGLFTPATTPVRDAVATLPEPPPAPYRGRPAPPSALPPPPHGG